MSDEPRQTKDWTGEEKLRVVLEAMKTSVAQVCAKYAQHGLSDEQVQEWRQHFVQRGGEVFEPKEEPMPSMQLGSRKRSPFLIFVATFSILVNFGLAALAAAVYFDLLEIPDWFGGKPEKVVHTAPPKRSPLDTLLTLDSSADPTQRPASRPKGIPTPTGSSGRPRVTVPLFGGPQPIPVPGIVSEVQVCGIQGRGSKIVFVLDLNEYMRTPPGGNARFERMRSELRDAILSLKEDTAFNVVLLHGISRLYVLEKSLVKATDAKKREAYSWLAFPVWDIPKGVKSRFGEPDLMVNPPEGVVGPWRALSAALSFNPEIIYLLTGDCSSLRPDDFSAFELSGVDVAREVRSPVWERWRRETDATRLTVTKWLKSDSLRAVDLEVSDVEVDNAIRQLGLALPVKPAGSPDSRWPWKSMYSNFTGGLMRAIPDLASTHMVLSLPEGLELPAELEGASREFTQLSGGSFTILDDTFFSSP